MIYLLIFAGVMFLTTVLENKLQNPNILTKDSLYNSISLYDTTKDGHPIRVMSLDGKLDSAMFLDSEDLVFDYTKYYRLVYTYNPNLKKILVIGGAGYSVPKDFLNKGVQVDVVEIDPELTHLAALYFKLPNNPYLHIYHEDGRTFLNRQSGAQYDAIMLDAFKSYNIPFQLTTAEAVQKMKKLLTPNGVLLANIISAQSGERGQFLAAENATFKQSFPVVDTYLVNEPSQASSVQNVMLIAAANPHADKANAELSSYLSHQATPSAVQTKILTDDFAPVDQMMLKTIL